MKKKHNNKDLAVIAGNIAKLYEEGIPLLKIISLLDEMPLKKDYKLFLKVMEDVINKGGSLEEAFSKEPVLFPKFFIAMVAIGEKTGRIIYVLKGLDVFYSKMAKIKSTVISQLTYPFILIIALFILLILVVFFFLPSMTNIIISMDKELPPIYENVLKFQESVKTEPVVFIIAFLAWGVIIPFYIIKNYFLKYIKKLFQKIPLCNLMNEYKVIVILSVVMNSGINIVTGINYCCEDNFNKDVAAILKRLSNDIMKGIALGESMSKTSKFSSYTLAHIKLGEESGGLDQRLELLEKVTFNRVIDMLNKFMQFLQPTLILVIGIGISVFIIVFILPLLDNMML